MICPRKFVAPEFARGNCRRTDCDALVVVLPGSASSQSIDLLGWFLDLLYGLVRYALSSLAPGNAGMRPDDNESQYPDGLRPYDPCRPIPGIIVPKPAVSVQPWINAFAHQPGPEGIAKIKNRPIDQKSTKTAEQVRLRRLFLNRNRAFSSVGL
jgi:hypothetical protein